MESQQSAGNPITLIIVAHAPLASALLAVVKHVHGGVPGHVHAVDVAADEAPELTQNQIASLVRGQDALILTDLLGATPHNCAQQACGEWSHVRTLSSVSAPVLLRAVNYSHLPLQSLYDKLTAA